MRRLFDFGFDFDFDFDFDFYFYFGFDFYFYFYFDFDFVDYKEVIRWGVLAEKPDWVFGAEMAACKGRFFLILSSFFSCPHFLIL